MANQIIIDIGAVANDGTGDPLRTAFGYVNDNFSNIWSTGVANSNVAFDGNKILTVNTNGNLVLAPNGTGKVVANVDIVPNTANTRNLGALTNRWSTVYSQYLNVSNDVDFAGDVTINGNLTVEGDTIQIGNIVTDTKTIQLANTASTANAANGSGITVGASDNIATMLYNSTSNTWTMNIGANITGNVTAPYFIGNGSQLTGIDSGNIISTSNIAIDTSAQKVTISVGLSDWVFDETGVLTIPGEIDTVGNVTAPYFIGNGSQLTGVSNYANANAVAYGQAGWAGNIIPATSNVYSLGSPTHQWNDLYVSNATIYMNNVPVGLTAGNVLTVDGQPLLSNDSNTSISTTGNITATEFFGNIAAANVVGTVANATYADLSASAISVPAANVTGLSNVATSGSYSDLTGTPTIPTATSNLTNDSGYITTATANVISVNGQSGVVTLSIPTATSNLTNDSGYITTGNLGSLTSNVTTTANISGGYILGNGSQLTGLPASYTDSNVTTLLASLGSNTISGTGNITTTANISGQYVLGNAAFMTGIPASYGNANVADFLDSLGSNAIVTTGNISGGNLLASGYANITGNINGSGATFSGNVTAANFSGNISITGNVTGTSPNVSLVAGSYTYTFDNTGVLSLPAVGGDEGGEINFAIPTANTTLTGPVKVDVYQDRLRFFDGSTNGAYLDLANCPSGVSAAIGYRDIPQISFSANATATGNAAGCHYYSTTAGNLQLTIPDNANVAFPTGATLTIVMNAAGNVIVAQGTGVTLYMAGSSTTGNRTVGAYGLASVMKVAANTWVISGTGVY